jgi:fibronectin type 3 domain-containing protein
VTYRYALYTVDKSGLMSKSNVLTAQTVSSPPAAVTLSAYVVSESEVELDWSRSTAIDFASYQLFRSDDDNVTTSSTLLQTQTTSTTTTYRDTDRKPATDYYYAVFTVDKAGLSAKSNVVKVTTAENLRPDSVTLFISKRDSIPASVTLGWTKNGDKDFESYRVYRSDTQGSAGKLITAVTAQSTTQYLDNGIDRRNTYYYTVIVYDKYGMASKVSNEVISGPN